MAVPARSSRTDFCYARDAAAARNAPPEPAAGRTLRMEAPRAPSVTSKPYPTSLLQWKEVAMPLLIADNETAGHPPAETDALTDFVVNAQLMLDPATPEPVRREAEPRLLAVLPTLQALGVFELLAIRDAALATMVRDELEARRSSRG